MKREEVILTFKGQIFDENLDLRDIAFFSTKTVNILDKSYKALTGNNQNVRSKFHIHTQQVKHSSLELQMVLDYGLALTPILMEHPLTVWEVFQKTVEYIQVLKEFLSETKGKHMNITIENSPGAVVLVAENQNIGSISIPAPVYQAMLNTDREINEINKKIEQGNLSAVLADNKPIMNVETYESINQGLEVVEYLKKEQMDSEHRAEIEVFEFNKSTMKGKALFINTDLFGIEKPDRIDFALSSEVLVDDILDSMRGEKIVVIFRPLLENLYDKKVFKSLNISSVAK